MDRAQGPSKAGSFHNNSQDSVASSINHGKEAVTTAAQEAVDAGGAALKTLQRDLSDLKETVEKLISQASNETARSARGVAGQVRTAASDIAERGAHVASTATDQAKTLVTELENIARRNPLGALAGGVFVGILIGIMGRRNWCFSKYWSYSGSIFSSEWQRFGLTSKSVLTQDSVKEAIQRAGRLGTAFSLWLWRRFSLLALAWLRSAVGFRAIIVNFMGLQQSAPSCSSSPSAKRSHAWRKC
jgi:ElaB/YqjD/DUF883 family membrane-anchored ribosome-binding protein